MSRRVPRYRIDTAATAVPLLGGEMAVCRTLDVSEVGTRLDTAAWFALGTRLAVALVDPEHGSAVEALEKIDLDAVVAELDLADPRLQPIMDSVRRRQPAARRILRGRGAGDTALVHRFVDRDAGLDALLDAVTADLPMW